MSNTALATVEDFDHSKIALIKNTVAKGASDNELDLFLYTCKRTGLDPLARQIYFVKRQENKPGTIQTGIDGYRLIADRTGKYAGNDDPAFGSTERRQFKNYNEYIELEVPLTATVTVWKIVAGQRCPFTATARWSEYYPGDPGGQQWRKMPYLMLGKCAEALALRKAFPAELSGLYTDAEMDQAGQQTPPLQIVQAPSVETITATLKRKTEVTTDQARTIFYEHFGPVLCHPENEPTFADVRRVLGLEADVPEPTHVDGWRQLWKVVDAAIAVETEQAA